MDEAGPGTREEARAWCVAITHLLEGVHETSPASQYPLYYFLFSSSLCNGVVARWPAQVHTEDVGPAFPVPVVVRKTFIFPHKARLRLRAVFQAPALQG